MEFAPRQKRRWRLRFPFDAALRLVLLWPLRHQCETQSACVSAGVCLFLEKTASSVTIWGLSADWVVGRSMVGRPTSGGGSRDLRDKKKGNTPSERSSLLACRHVSGCFFNSLSPPSPAWLVRQPEQATRPEYNTWEHCRWVKLIETCLSF